jgi:hypothetical protein
VGRGGRAGSEGVGEVFRAVTGGGHAA